MLSRTANGLFWMSRYVERAENIARLLDAGHHIEALPSTGSDRATEWSSVVIASGCRTTFPHPLEEADQKTVSHHLIFDRENPSSIHSCIGAARENARAMRIAITSEVWDSINEAWAEMRVMTPDILAGGGFASFVDWVKKRCSEFRGAVDSSLLRDDGFAFIELGKWIERADATARLLDVKYHVLLPSAEDVGGGLDYMQWQQILRAANSLRAYRYVYRKPVTAEGVVDFLVLNEKTPRSLKRCYAEIVEAIEDIGAPLVSQKRVYIRARRSLDELNEETAAGVLSYGLHEWLTETIVETNTLAGDIGTAYGFTAPVELQE